MTVEKPRDPIAGELACLEAERLAEYIDGRLTNAERATIERHLVDCSDCRSAVVETVRFAQEEDATADASPEARISNVVPFRRRWIAAAALAVTVAAGVLLIVQPSWIAGRYGASTRPELAGLVAAMATSPTRAVDARLTGGFPYAPPPSPTRGAALRDLSPEIRIATAEVEARASRSRTPENVAALGVAYLISGDLDRAISTLEAAVALAPGRAAFISDLSAAYLARGKYDGRPEDVRAAMAAAERALQADPQLLEAQFNRALAGAALPEPDRRGLTSYIQSDQGAWADEAKRRLSELPQ